MEWNESGLGGLRDALTERPGVALFLGATDTGKSTLIRELASQLATSGPTAVIDCDVGQSSVGPPACLGACMVKGAVLCPSRAEVLHFVGSFSPKGYFLPMLSGLDRLLHWARKRALHILVDTTGYVFGGAAFELKYHKVEFSQPRHLICLERGKELQPLLHSLRWRQEMDIHRLKVPDAASIITMDERRTYRESALAQYLENASLFAMTLAGKVMVNPSLWREIQDQDGLEHRMVGLLDGQGNTLALGIIHDVDQKRGSLVVEAPIESVEAVKHLRLGEKAPMFLAE